MEILSKTADSGLHYFAITLSSIGALALIVLGIGVLTVSVVDKEIGWNELGAMVVTFGLGTILIIGVISAIEEGPTVTYKAIVTDYNEVYENGYKVVGQEGKITILEKVK